MTYISNPTKLEVLYTCRKLLEEYHDNGKSNITFIDDEMNDKCLNYWTAKEKVDKLINAILEEKQTRQRLVSKARETYLEWLKKEVVNLFLSNKNTPLTRKAISRHLIKVNHGETEYAVNLLGTKSQVTYSLSVAGIARALGTLNICSKVWIDDSPVMYQLKGV